MGLCARGAPPISLDRRQIAPNRAASTRNNFSLIKLALWSLNNARLNLEQGCLGGLLITGLMAAKCGVRPRAAARRSG